MKKNFLFILVACMVLPLYGQQPTTVVDSVTLDEVVVHGARVIDKVDGQQIFPSQIQKGKSTSAYGLLGKLALPNIKVDEVLHTISADGRLGDVQVRINDVIASREQLLALDLKAVRYVDYIRSPGVRYGDNVAFVINIVTARAVRGYALGTNFTQALTTRLGNNMAYVDLNYGKSQFGISYSFGYRNLTGRRTEETFRYLLEDGSVYSGWHRDLSSKDKMFGNNLQFTYSIADSNRYVLQAKLTVDADRTPNDRQVRQSMLNGVSVVSELNSTDKSTSPALDLYWHAALGAHESITANTLGTYICSAYTYYNKENRVYEYGGKGNSYSLLSEAIYENKLRLFTFSTGMQYRQKYVENTYTGDISAHVGEHSADCYVYTQLKGRLSVLNYMLGMGLSRIYYRQSADRYTYYLLRPKFTLSYPFLHVFTVKYDFSIAPHAPQPQYLTDVAVKVNAMDINAGNPHLRSDRRLEHQFTLSYQDKRLYSELMMLYRNNYNCIMQSIERTPAGFVFARTNQRAINMLLIQGYNQYEIIPSIFTATWSASVLRCLNYGNNYKHHYTGFSTALQLNAYLGRFTFAANIDNGWRWLEGENKGYQAPAYYVLGTYKWGNVDLSLHWQHCMQHNPLTMRAELLNKYVNKTTSVHQKDFGNMLSFTLTWHFSHGRKYAKIVRTMKNSDTESGLLKK